ncbi:MAG TPA: hypothetical protein VMF08_03880 [Candidatus Sulfotelmatobacter sp.]|nr:hypothetical protein [Candidatus Sulfotelmatobacter sp.]
MIETIRKHSKWLLYIIAAATIFSMVFYMSSAGHSGNGAGGGVNTNLVSGEIYGQAVTEDMYERMEKGVDLDFFFHYGEFPEQNPQVTPEYKEQMTYIRMMEVEKAQQLGVHVTMDQTEQMAANYLRSPTLQRVFQVRDEAVPLNNFVSQVLEPAHLTEDDFANFIHDNMAIEQVQMLYGLAGQLVTPQEATNEYVREYQEYSTEIIFFSASNFLDRVSVSPGDVAEFYTNYMANYRLPDRVQVSYVVFNVTNFFGQAEHGIGSSNLDLEVQNVVTKYGSAMNAVPDAKTEDDAREEIRKFLIRREAMQLAVTQADNFAQSVFNIQPASAQSLETAARHAGLTVEHPAPFGADYGPSEFTAPPAFTRTAFELSSDSPLSEPVEAPDGIYLIAYQTNFPSEIPPLYKIRDRVTEDLKMRLATITAEREGTNFAHQASIQMAAGKSFAAVGFAAGLSPQVLPPFSLTTQDMPELGDHATLNQLKEVVLMTAVGTASPFVPTDDGGFILYVQSRYPIDQQKMAEEMPQFIEELRNQRGNQAYSDWQQHEANRELRDTPIARGR